MTETEDYIMSFPRNDYEFRQYIIDGTPFTF